MEASVDMGVVKVRKEYPGLQMLEDIPKSDIALGKDRTDKLLEPVFYLYRRCLYLI